MKNTVEMLDPETGETFVAIVDDEKPVPYTKITGQQVVALAHDRDELLAALKGVCSAWKKHLLPHWNGYESTLPVPDEVTTARALIARIEGGNG